MKNRGALSEKEFREISLNANLLPLVFRLGAPLAFYSLFNAFFQIPAETSHVGFAEKIVFFSHLQYLLSLGIWYEPAFVKSRVFNQETYHRLLIGSNCRE